MFLVFPFIMTTSKYTGTHLAISYSWNYSSMTDLPIIYSSAWLCTDRFYIQFRNRCVPSFFLLVVPSRLSGAGDTHAQTHTHGPFPGTQYLSTAPDCNSKGTNGRGLACVRGVASRVTLPLDP